MVVFDNEPEGAGTHEGSARKQVHSKSARRGNIHTQGQGTAKYAGHTRRKIQNSVETSGGRGVLVRGIRSHASDMKSGGRGEQRRKEESKTSIETRAAKCGKNKRSGEVV